MTLADEATNLIPTDEANGVILESPIPTTTTTPAIALLLLRHKKRQVAISREPSVVS